MKKIVATTTTALFTFVLPYIASAQITDKADAGQFEDLLLNIMTFINDILIPFIIAIGFLSFVWGMFQYFILGGANDDAKAKGKSLMIYATLGFVIIIIFFGIINLITSSIGLEGQSVDSVPSIVVPK